MKTMFDIRHTRQLTCTLVSLLGLACGDKPDHGAASSLRSESAPGKIETVEQNRYCDPTPYLER